MATKSPCLLQFHIDPNPASRRGLAFLIFPGNANVTAKIEFDRLKDNDKRWFKSIFDFWLDGGIRPAYFHGWDTDEFEGKYTQLFVFKQRSRKHRFYGFLCHPKDNNLSYEQCVLVNYASKGAWETDERILRACEDVRQNPDVQREIRICFANIRNGGQNNGKHKNPLDRKRH
jgi:hypothetical protein